jgi:hypothetical protein
MRDASRDPEQAEFITIFWIPLRLRSGQAPRRKVPLVILSPSMDSEPAEGIDSTKDLEILGSSE